jgi:hypothetical protein
MIIDEVGACSGSLGAPDVAEAPLELNRGALRITARRAGNGRRRYTDGMTSKEVTEILERVLSWPEERQAEIVRAMELLEDQAASECELMGE